MGHLNYDEFFLKFFLNSGQKLENIAYSSLGIGTIFGMLLSGLGSSSYTELEQGLCVKDGKGSFASLKDHFAHIVKSTAGLKSDNLTFHMANKMLVNKVTNLKEEFKAGLTETFNCSSDIIDFSNPNRVSDLVNHWVAQMTYKKISKILEPESITADSQLVLINAVYFKGAWKKKFKKELTRPSEFLLSNGSTSTVDMMMITDTFAYLEDSSEKTATQILALDFDSRFTMLIFLPKNKTGDSLSDLANHLLSESNLKERVIGKMRNVKVHVFLPRFRVESNFDLVTILKSLGVKKIFDSGADFSGMVHPGDSERFFVSKAIHKAFIEIDEAGAEAAAATAVVICTRSMRMDVDPVIEFRADHPFMAIIYDRELNIPVFTGLIYDPPASTSN